MRIKYVRKRKNSPYYYFTQSVPADLHDDIGKKVIKFRLATNKRIAGRLASRHAAYNRSLFKKIRESKIHDSPVPDFPIQARLSEPLAIEQSLNDLQQSFIVSEPQGREGVCSSKAHSEVNEQKEDKQLLKVVEMLLNRLTQGQGGGDREEPSIIPIQAEEEHGQESQREK